MGGTIKVNAGWALWGKSPGSNHDYSVLASSSEPFSEPEFASVVAYFAPGSPPAERGLPNSLPWVTISRVGVDERLYVGIMIQDGTEEVDGAGRPIIRTSYFCIAYSELAETPISYADLCRQLMSLRLPREGRGLICLSLPQLDPEALAADVVSVFGGAVVATTVALLLSGPVSIIGSEGTTIHERLRFLDAVAALLPYGYRAWYTATTWSDSSVRHRIRLAFATRPRQDAKIIRWGVVPAALSDGSPGEAYLRLLHQIREQAPDPKGLTDLIRFLAQDAEPRRFEQPEYVVDSLRKFSLGLIM